MIALWLKNLSDMAAAGTSPGLRLVELAHSLFLTPVCVGVCHLQLSRYQLLQVHCLLHTEVKDLFTTLISPQAIATCLPLIGTEPTGLDNSDLLALLE